MFSSRGEIPIRLSYWAFRLAVDFLNSLDVIFGKVNIRVVRRGIGPHNGFRLVTVVQTETVANFVNGDSEEVLKLKLKLYRISML